MYGPTNHIVPQGMTGYNPMMRGPDGFFFFSSRRRHTRFDCDWSSDVCSSDLPHIDALAADGLSWTSAFSQASWTRPSVATILTGLYPSSHGAVHKADRLPDREIGRASCRERV